MGLCSWVDELGLLVLRCEGHVTASELRQFLANWRMDSRWRGDSMVDLTDVTDTDVMGSDIAALAHWPFVTSRLAIVAPRPLLIGLSRMFQISAELGGQKILVGIFPTHDEASAWLQRQSTGAASAGS